MDQNNETANDNDVLAAEEAGEDDQSDDDDDDDDEEELEDGRFRREENLPLALQRGDPNRMRITRAEHGHAIAIKEAIEALPDLDNLSDLMYVQLAIICKDDIENAIERCYAIQAFREEYNIVDTYEQGCRYLDWAFQLFPRHFLSFAFCEADGIYVFVYDHSHFDPKAFPHTGVDDWYKVMYFSYHLFFPDVESIRKGIIHVVECEGVGMKRDVLNIFDRFYTQFLSQYPHNGQIRCFHTGTMFNILVSILRRILPPQLKINMRVGFQYDGNWGDVFLVPTVEEANRRMLERMKTALSQRYDNERSFVL